jgi:hypothetical protein
VRTVTIRHQRTDPGHGPANILSPSFLRLVAEQAEAFGNRPSYYPAAVRMRSYWKRRRQGLRYVRIALHVTDIDALIRMRFLKEKQREDPEALQTAVLGVVYRACEDAG